MLIVSFAPVIALTEAPSGPVVELVVVELVDLLGSMKISSRLVADGIFVVAFARDVFVDVELSVVVEVSADTACAMSATVKKIEEHSIFAV